MSEPELIKKSKLGDAAAFEELIKPYEQRIFSFLSRMCGAGAADLTQETLLQAFKKIKELRQETKFSSWLFQIAANNCLMLKRTAVRHKESSIDEVVNERYREIADLRMDPEKDYDRGQLRLILEQALQSLTPPYRAVVILKEIDKLTNPEIAEIMQIPLSTVKARLRRAKAKLKHILNVSFLGT